MNNLQEQSQEETYQSIREYVINTQKKVYVAVNFAMVNAYWEIGEQIFRACGENDRAGYGKQLLKYLSEKLTIEFGKGFDVSNLRNMRKFYLTFQKRDALRPELSWTHYRSLMRVPDEKVRDFYLNEGDNPPIGILLCADKSDTLVRYTLPEDNTQIYAAKYLPYMPTEEELRRELRLDEFKKLETE